MRRCWTGCTARRCARCALLAAEDQHAFDTAPSDLLGQESTLHGPSASPSSLLPLVPIALTALAYRTWAGPLPSTPTTCRTP